MKVKRTELLNVLQVASIGLSKKEVLEQSNSFVFNGDHVCSFNDEIMTSIPSPITLNVVVLADDLLRLLAKFPDEEVDVEVDGGELIIKGKRRKAGITCEEKCRLPLDAVPQPDEWHELDKATANMLLQAARCCGQDETQFLTTCVHVTDKLIEACDNYRLLRADMKTGFPKEILIPASSIHALAKNKLTEVGISEGWCHFKTGEGHEFSARASHEKYHSGMDALLKMPNAEDLTLPANLAEIVERAEVMNDAGYDSRVTVSIDDGKLILSSRKETGWYKETKRVKYSGVAIEFHVHPQFLVDMLERTKHVRVSTQKMKLEHKGVQFVTSLAVAQ